MIRLRVIGTTPDSSQLVLSNKPRGRRGSHTVDIDDRLFSVLQDAVYTQREAGEEREPLQSRSVPTAVAPPRVAPREIQRMLRGGMTVAQVARAADVDEDYVEQFYPPVYYEREGVIREAQAQYTEKARLGESGLPLGDAVARNLAQRRLKITDAELANMWTATRLEGRPWVVTLVFPWRGRPKKAMWTFDQRARTISAANKLAADLGWVPSGARRVGLGSSRAMAPAGSARARRKTTARRKPARKKAATRKRPTARRKPATRKRTATRKKTTARRKPARRKTTARRKPARKKSATRKRPAARRKTTTRKRPTRKAPRKKAAARKRPAARRKTTTKKRSATRRRPARRR